MISAIDIHNKVETKSEDHCTESGRWTRYATGAVCGLAGGVLFPIFGGFLMAARAVPGRADDFAQYLGIALMVLTLPMIIFGIGCLVRIVDDSILKS